MTNEELSAVISGYGLSSSSMNFNWAHLMGGVIFGIIGFCAFNYGRKEKHYRALAIGIVLMVYPYFVPNAILLYLLGIGFSSLLYFWRE
jgi:hypothetical protein